MMILAQSNFIPRNKNSFYWPMYTCCVCFFNSFHVFVDISISLLIQRKEKLDHQTKVANQITHVSLSKILTIRFPVSILLTANKDLFILNISVILTKMLPFSNIKNFVQTFYLKLVQNSDIKF